MYKEEEQEDDEDQELPINTDGDLSLQPFSVYVRIRPLLNKSKQRIGKIDKK